MKLLLLLLLLLLISSSTMASSLSINVGNTKAVFNRFAIPNTDEDQISLPVEDTLTSYRLAGNIDLASGNQIYFLVAPLSTTYNFTSTKQFEFDNQMFSTGVMTDVEYKFNSYRLGYLWKWNFSSLQIWGGFIGKIRDAQIKVSQGNKSRAYDNVGFVPLAAFGFELYLSQSISLYSHTDALTASQGSAYDSQLEIRYNLDNVSLSLGKRILGGGVDNDKVYNFSQFDTIYAGITYLFK